MERTERQSRRESRAGHARLQAVLTTLVIVVGCGHSPSRSERWFTERGRQSPTWHSCLRMGAELRNECGADQACAQAVTRELTRRCYAGRYDQEASHAKPSDQMRAERLSPCFWDDEDEKPASVADYARDTCTKVVEQKLQPACVAELREVIEGICADGAMDLTGTGP